MQKITAVAFLYKDQQVLVAKRSDSSGFLPGVYELPGGHIKLGETMEEGLARELKEECGIDITVGEPFHAFTYMNSDNTKQTVEVIYFAVMNDPSQEIMLDTKEHSAFKWISADDVGQSLQDNEKERLTVSKGFDLLASAIY